MKKLRPAGQTAGRYWFIYLMILPTAAYLAVFQVYPLIESVRLSFTNLSLLVPGSGKYVGLQNYIRLLVNDANFMPILRNTLWWVVCTTPLQMLLGMAAAVPWVRSSKTPVWALTLRKVCLRQLSPSSSCL